MRRRQSVDWNLRAAACVGEKRAYFYKSCSNNSASSQNDRNQKLQDSLTCECRDIPSSRSQWCWPSIEWVSSGYQSRNHAISLGVRTVDNRWLLECTRNLQGRLHNFGLDVSTGLQCGNPVQRLVKIPSRVVRRGYQDSIACITHEF